MLAAHAALAEGAADALAGSDLPHQDHLIHMPSHIYLRVGRWHDAVAANTRALDVEEQLAQRCAAAGAATAAHAADCVRVLQRMCHPAPPASPPMRAC